MSATLRNVTILALALLVFALAPAHTRRGSNFGASVDLARSIRAARLRAPSAPRSAHAPLAPACRLVAPTHHTRLRHEGSVHAVHERYGGKAQLCDDDLNDGFDPSCDADDSSAALRDARRTPKSGCTSRGTSLGDPSRFAAGRALPRGPPV